MILRSMVFLLLAVEKTCNGRPQDNDGIEANQRQLADLKPSSHRYAYFDVELLEAVSRLEEGNIALSPISVKVILAMLMEGSTGLTSSQIRQALRLPDDSTAAREIIHSWIQPFQEKAEMTKLSLATHLFLMNDHTPNPNFSKIMEENFHGGLKSLSVDSVNATKEINDWVNKETNGFIPTLVTPEQLTSDTHALLASAVYFKGLWKNPFESWQSRCFYKTEGDCVPSMFMHRTDTYKYAYIGTLDAQAVEIPYKDDRFSMLIVVSRGNVNQLGRDLLHEHLHRVLSKLKPQEVQVQLPRFSLDYKQDLVTALRHLQISEAFSLNANFSGILESKNDSVSVANVFHSVKIVVDEEGSEAAAATGALFVPLMGNQVLSFTADKPFFFFIRDSVNNATLFTGRVTDPEKTLSEFNKDVKLADKLPPGRRVTTENIQESIYGALLQTEQKKKPYVPLKPGRPGDLMAPTMIGVSAPESNQAEEYDDPVTTTQKNVKRTQAPPLNRRPELTKPSTINGKLGPNKMKPSPEVYFESRPFSLVAQESDKHGTLAVSMGRKSGTYNPSQQMRDPTKIRRSSYAERIAFLS